MTKRNLTAAKVARTRKAGIRTALMLSTGALALVAAAPALAQVPDVDALPGGGAIVGGTGTINAPVGNHLQVDQSSDRLLINWNNFDIGENASVDFDQQAGNQSIAVNRVIGSGMAPSLIFGEMTANGTVVIINGNGVIFGGTADVDVGRLVATTSDVNDAGFMNGGALQFSGLSSDTGAISILSGASISVAEAGLAAFVAPRVSNAGVITARGGRVVLASGVDYTLDFAGDGLLEFALGADSPLVTQAGQILAEGGLVQITAAAAAGLISDVINVSGSITVTSVDLEDGVIVLSAGEGDGGGINVSSDLTVSGDIEIEGRRIHGAGDIDVTDGELVLNLNAGGADTTAETLIADALGVIGAVAEGTTLGLGAGDYRGGAVISANNVTLAGTPGARIVVPALPAGQEMNGLTISADNVTIRDLEIVGPALNESWVDFAWNAPASGGTTRGIAVWVGADNFSIADNVIQGLRTGIVIDGRNAGGSVTGNIIDNTKSAISVQYTDAGLLNAEGFALDISGNDDGPFGNEWGVNFHLNGHQQGGGLVGNAVKISNTASSAVQAALLAWSAANNGMSAQDQGYNFANRTHVNVAVGGGVNAQGSLLSAIGSVQGGVDAVVAGGHVNILAGDYAGLVSINKSVTLHGAGMDETRLTGGINLPNTAFSNLTLQGFTLSGDGGGNTLVRNGRVTNLTIDDVRFDGENVAGRHGFAGGQFGGAISITNSEFIDIRGWSAFDTSTGGTATAITSVVFSDNLLDGTVGHVTFRQATPTADVLISGNTVRNVGDTTDLSSAIFKVFGGATVDFIGNEVTGVGASPTKLTAGVNDGAALLVRGVGTLNITDNIFTDNQQAFLVGAGNALPTVTNIAGNTFTNNAWDIFLPASTGGAINFGAGNNFISGADTMAHLVWVGSTAVDMTGVMFDGELGSAMSDAELFALEARIYHGVDATGVGLVSVKDGHLFATATAGNLGRAIDLATDGDTVNVADGTHNIGSTRLIVDESITLTGQSEAGTIIDGRGVGGGLGTMLVSADDVSLSNFTLYGADSGVNNYGIKVQPNPTGYSPTQRLYNFSISDVTVQGSTRAELDLNGVIGATITNFTANGYRVGTSTVTGGAGIQITDSQDIYLSGVTTLGNDWGSVAIYQSNKAGAYDGLTSNINIDGTNSDFSEFLGVFVESYSTLHPQIGQLNLTGFDYAVRNPAHRAGGENFTFFRSDFADATAFALALANAGSGSIERYTGTAYTNEFTVVDGLLINSALRDVRAGGVVNVGAGTFNETVAITRGVTLDGAGMDDTFITGGIALSGTINDLVLSDFSVSGVGGSNTVIRNGGLVTGFTMDGVRVDGDSVAGRFGVVGGQFGGDLSITDSEFLNINGWAVFDTRSGAGTNQGSVITSAVFSNNVLDNVQGHVNFRHDLAGGAFPDVVFSGNTVTNVGDATNSFGAIFKAFNADSVLFSANSVSDIGTSGFNPAGEAAYGAVLMVRGASDLTISNNTFTNNHMVFAVEPGRGLATHTTITGNTFTNNAWSIYMPANALTGGTVSFGAGNNFVAGPDTVQHIVWRGAADLDLTNVMFDGLLGSAMTLEQLFDLEDLLSHAVDADGVGFATVLEGHLYATATTAGALTRAVGLAGDGDTVNVANGTHVLTSTLNIADSINLAGQSRAGTIINATAVTGYGMLVTADDVSLSGFTFQGDNLSTQSSRYGVKVQPGGSGAADRIHDFAIADVTIQGFGGSELDLNGVIGATITNVTVDGQDTKGVGIGITDSADVTLSGVTTLNNLWGSVALYQTNRFYDQQLTDIHIDAGDNSFGEALGVFAQSYSDIGLEIGDLYLTGFDFTVVNPDHRTDGDDFTFFRTSLDDAIDFAVNLNPAESDSSLVQGFDGSVGTGHYYVGVGTLLGGGTQNLSIQTAFDGSTTDSTVHVASGDYAEALTLNGRRTVLFGEVGVTGLTIAGGAGGSSLAGDLTAGAGGLTFAANIYLAGDLSLTTTGGGVIDLTLIDGTTEGGQSLTIVGSDSVTLGAVGSTDALASLDVTGTSIVTAGANTTGGQSYDGALTLSGAYVASDFSANSAATLAGDTAIDASGDVVLGTVDGAHDLSIDAASVSLAQVGGTTALGDLNIASAAILTAGATTTGLQSYDGLVTLDGAYQAASFSAGAALLGGDVWISADAAASLGSVDGAHDLDIDADTVSLGATGATTALASLTIEASSIEMADGASVSGAVALTGAASLGGAFEVGSLTAGALQLAGDLSIDADGDVSLGAVDGGHGLVIGGGAVTLGAVGSADALASLDVTGTTIVTAGANTTGVQTYMGALTLAGAYVASDVSASGAATLAGDTAIDASGDVTLASVDGGHALSVAAGGSATLGAVGGTTALDSLNVSGASIVANGAITTGGQTYSGAVRFAGDYHLIGAGDFTASGAATLTGDTLIETADGAILLGSVNGSSAGGQSLTLDAGDNDVTVGDFGRQVRLGAVLVQAARTVLQGNVYAGDSLRFTGGDGATVRLTRASTTFNTTQSSSAAGDITIQPHLIGTTAGGQSVVFIAGAGLSSSASGDITLGDAGTEAIRLGAMTATGDNFSAATVKLADDYTSLLAGDQVFTDETLDTQGDVMINVAGNESGSITALGSVSIQAGGSATGKLTAGGPVNLDYGTGSNRDITSGGDVSLSSASGPIGGSINSGGAVDVNGGDDVSTTIVAEGDVDITTDGSITSDITTPSEVTLNAGQLIEVTVNAGSVVVNAPGGTVEGVFDSITTPGNTTIIVNGEAVIGDGNATVRQILVDRFLTPAGGIVGPSGQIQLPVGLAIALIAPAGEGEGQRRPIIVNDIERLGELLRLGYTAIVVQIDEGDEPAFEQELDLAQGEDTTPAS